MQTYSKFESNYLSVMLVLLFIMDYHNHLVNVEKKKEVVECVINGGCGKCSIQMKS